MKTEDQSSVYLDNNFKPPDRSTSAPPVLSLHSESLFAFRAAEHLQLFSDIRCEDYYELYNQYKKLEGGKGLALPLENQSFLLDRSYVEEDEHLINPLPHSNQQQQIPTHQQQIQQLQQQIQQQQQQIQQQMQFQQQYMQQHMHSPHPPHPQHIPPQPQYPQHLHSQQQQQQQQQHHSPLSQLPHQHVQQLQQHPAHQQHLPQHFPIQHNQFSHLTPLQQQQFQQMQHQQPHVGFPQHRGSVPDTRHPLPRSTSNPSYSMRGQTHGFDHIPEDQHEDDEGDTIWTPLPRRIATNVIDDYLGADDGQQQQQQQQQQQHNKRGGHYPPHVTTPPPQQQQQPASYYQNDFDNVAYSTAKQLLDEVAQGNIQSLWNDGAYDGRQQQPRQLQVPTPKNPSQANIISLLGGGYFNEAANPDKPRRNRTNSAGRLLPVPTTSPPLIQPVGPGSASTSPALPICRYYAQGFCSRGERCNFLHDDQSQQALGQLQDNAPFSVAKPKAKKTVSSPPPMSLPPKVPSPVNRGNGMHHNQNGMPNGNNSGNGSNNGNNNISNLIKSFGGINLDRDGRISPTGGILGLDRERDGSSPQPIPRSASANGLDLAFNGGSTSPNGKSDLTEARQYTSIEQVIGHIYSLCKDQHGCRFLQKKLEDRDPMIVEIIFNEVYDHMTELMIDPFGNYLCQKLLEHCNDEQRLEIIEKVAPDLVKISKNMHGTRAVQKMIEYLTTPEQITIAKKALSNHVVTLIQDLNGNHVIQRCLNRLSPQDNQFIYDSVSQAGHCVEVATHRHGCCVLQRCIDHASDSQKIQLINEIIANALVLVQDPYGNYVVQYVLDLPFPGLASRLARRFLGHIPILSTQKFSSNVVEKLLQCLNVTDVQTRAAIIQELVEYDNLLYLLQDPYANYVIQTSLNVSEPVQHARLVEAIRPHLTSLRNTPYGKRIQNKILKESSRDYYA